MSYILQDVLESKIEQLEKENAELKARLDASERWKVTEFLTPVREDYRDCRITAFGSKNKITEKEEWIVRIDLFTEPLNFNTSTEAIEYAKMIIDEEL